MTNSSAMKSTVETDALGRVLTTYASGTPFSTFKPDGSGTVFYPKGTIAVRTTLQLSQWPQCRHLPAEH